MIREFLTAPKIGLQVAATTILAYGAARFWPDADAAWFHYAVPSLFIAAGAWIGGPGLLQIIKYHDQLRRQRKAKEAERGERDAAFETEEGIERAGYFDPNQGVPVGKLNGRIIFFPFTHALVIAPAGSGKTISASIPALAHGYRVRGKGKNESRATSVFVTDLKRELKAMCARLRREMHGQNVRVLDPTDPLTDSYNLLDPIRHALKAGRSAKAITLCEFTAQVFEPEPPDDPKNKFWREGSRGILVLVMLYVCMTREDDATLIEVARIIRDAPELEVVLFECQKFDALGGELAVMARDILSQGKHLDEFRTAAALAVRSFSGAGELASVVGPSTFRFFDLKREPTTVFVCASLSETRAFGRWLKGVAECAMYELEAEPGNVPVHFCLDEATNIALDIATKMTALRASGVRVHLIFQERSEAERVWGKHALDTIQGEVDCEIYMGIQDSKLAQDLEKKLGTVEIVKPGYQTGENPWDAYRETSNTQRKPLMSSYEQMYGMKPDEQLVFLRSRKHVLRPIRCQRLVYADVVEWIAGLDSNPVEGGKLKGPPTISLHYGKRGVKVRSFKRLNRKIDWSRMRRYLRFFPPLWAAWAGFWIWLAHEAWLKATAFFNS
ncbi:MAG: type IV secretory system conjugative DNA transfer family protein [Gammaproteobacteria bacterium]